MTRTFALIAVAGIAGSAAAQGSFSLSNNADPAGVLPGTAVTITMSFNPGSAGEVLTSGFFRFGNSGAAGEAQAGTWNFGGIQGTGGVPQAGGSLGALGVSASQAQYGQSIPYQFNTQGEVFSYTFIAGDEGEVVIDMYALNARSGVFGGSAAAQLLFPNAAETSRARTTFSVVPTPGSAAVLGLGGLLAARRRR